ncbi:MAG: endolytic transglycosylase MltG [Thermoanaerobacteraceae bacterium]|nr:endolytic transglycosylase MltG [Thermoanaerobacteraceae bacterium]
MRRRFALIMLIFIAALAAGYIYYLMQPVSSSDDYIVIVIPQHAGVKEIAGILKERGVIRSPLAFELRVSLQDKSRVLKAGKYAMSPDMNLDEIIKKLEQGDIVEDTVKVTFPEGFTIKDMAARLNEVGLVLEDEFMKAVDSFDTSKYEYLKEIPEDRPGRLEGYLYPDTYTFKVDASPEDIINTMLTRFNVIYESNIKENLNGRKLDDIIKIASMIEREAVTDDDRPKIASVIYNRLNRGMKLQIDATVQYALGKHKEKLSLKDLEVDSQYNTYKVKGLPAGPISNPGLKSIMAALNPVETNYIYYVARGNGSHFFTDNYEEFLNAKNAFKEDK